MTLVTLGSNQSRRSSWSLSQLFYGPGTHRNTRIWCQTDVTVNTHTNTHRHNSVSMQMLPLSFSPWLPRSQPLHHLSTLFQIPTPKIAALNVNTLHEDMHSLLCAGTNRKLIFTRGPKRVDISKKAVN